MMENFLQVNLPRKFERSKLDLISASSFFMPLVSLQSFSYILPILDQVSEAPASLKI